MYDTYRIYFTDGSSTLITITEDDNIQDAVVEMCDQEGWSSEDVTNIIFIESTDNK
jgi:hypothetical protein